MMIRWTTIRQTERAILYRRGEPVRVLMPGRHIVPAWPLPYRLVRFEATEVILAGPDRAVDAEALVLSGALGSSVEVVEIGDEERALLWIDGRYERVLGPGRWLLWSGPRRTEIERYEATEGRLEHPKLRVVLDAEASRAGGVEVVTIPQERVGLVYRSGRLVDTATAGRYGYWFGLGVVSVRVVDLREQVLDLAGQELMSADKVTLRLNASLSYRVRDPERSVQVAEDAAQALYREAQLALRAVVGVRDLEQLLAERDALAEELRGLVRECAEGYGLEVTNLGIRDVVLPGEMKAILNRVVEAKRAAEANLITRREETAAMRSQANTAKMLESNPTLMRLRELEVLEKVADQANLQIVLSEGGLRDRLMKLV